jgi:hypothetical protein
MKPWQRQEHAQSGDDYRSIDCRSAAVLYGGGDVECVA